MPPTLLASGTWASTNGDICPLTVDLIHTLVTNYIQNSNKLHNTENVRCFKLIWAICHSTTPTTITGNMPIPHPLSKCALTSIMNLIVATIITVTTTATPTPPLLVLIFVVAPTTNKTYLYMKTWLPCNCYVRLVEICYTPPDQSELLMLRFDVSMAT